MLGIFDDKDPPKQAPFANDTCPTMLTPQKKWAVEAFVGFGGPSKMRVPIFSISVPKSCPTK
jgi:hypothetical protein